VTFPANGAVRRAAAGAVLLVALFAPGAARAASSSFTAGDQAVVQVQAGNHSEVTVRAWDKPTIEFETDDESVQVNRRPIAFGTPQQPLAVSIPVQNIKVRDPATGAMGESTLPPEDFPYAASFRAGEHDTVRIVTGPASHITVMVPATVAILDARIRGTGILIIDGYHGGTLFAVDFGGRMMLSNINSAAFLQPMHGRLSVNDSMFDRLRVRSNTASLVFERSRARQIEASTVSGSMVWDDGAFDAGLARFESTYGSIGIGVANGARVEARSGDGHVYGLWDKRTPLEMRGDNEASATVDGGGPVVNAVSTHGDVFLYDGSLTTRKSIPPDWRHLNTTLRPPDPTPPPVAGMLHPAGPGHRPTAFERYRALRAAATRALLRRRARPQA
jgi:hypothetical protein